MRAFIAFWKKDIINKLIIVMLLLLILGVGGILYLLANMPKDSLFYTYLESTDGGGQGSATIIPSATFTEFATVMVPPRSIITPSPDVIATNVPSLTAVSATPESAISITTPSASPPPEIVHNADNASCIPDNPHTLARIIEVLDGNTVRAYYDEKVFVVRYIGIEVPGERDVYGQAAYWKNTELVYAKDVVLIPGSTETDPRGRLLRYVLVGETFVNYELIQQGLASTIKSSSEFACAEIFQNAEEQAIAARSGMWISTPAP